jgi:ribosome-binding protein aMBF1 (putative translation factor)
VDGWVKPGHDEVRSQVTTLRALKRKWMKDPAFRREYDVLEEEFAVLLEVAMARRRARLGWSELAQRMKTTRRTIAKLENGRLPSTRTLARFAKATGHRLKISFEPSKEKPLGAHVVKLRNSERHH